MGNYGAATMGIEAAPTTLEESVGGILNNVSLSSFWDGILRRLLIALSRV